MIKKIVCLAVVITFILSSAPVFAQDEGQGMQRILKSTVYGGVIGLVVGFAFMLLTDEPEDHYDFLSTGAGIGILGGLTYGVVTSSGRIAIVEVEDGKIQLNVPDLKADIIENERFNTKEMVTTVGLFNYRF